MKLHIKKKLCHQKTKKKKKLNLSAFVEFKKSNEKKMNIDDVVPIIDTLYTAVVEFRTIDILVNWCRQRYSSTIIN